MKTNKLLGRVIGAMFLLHFVLGILIYQFLQGSLLFETAYYDTISSHQFNLTISIVLEILSGVLSVSIALLILPTLKEYNSRVSYLYLSFCIINFFALLTDAVAVASMMEYGKLISESHESVDTLSQVLLKRHWWTHYLSLFISCFPVFTFFYALIVTKLIPSLISYFGLIAVTLMLFEILLSLFNAGLGMNMLLPIALAQLILPLWLIIRSFSARSHET